MADLPEYLNDQTEEVIRQRMLDSLPSDLDKAEGSYIYDAIAPAAVEMALAAVWAQEVLRRGFASTVASTVPGQVTKYLDLRAEEHGLKRKPAVKATGTIKFTGAAGTMVPAGTRVSTQADPANNVSAVEFSTDTAVTLDGTGVGFANITAVTAGKEGNVAAGKITIMAMPVNGVTAVTNEVATLGGLDIEDDISLLARYLQRVRSPSAGGNKADYTNWALEVTGVGGVSVVPVEDGPGTVSVYLIDNTQVPASQNLVDSVQNYIAPPWVNETEAESMTTGGAGVSIDTTQTDDTGDSVKMVYDSAGTGTLTHSNVQNILQQPGIWQVRVRVKVDATSGTADLLQIGIWNVSANAWAKISASSTTDAVQTLQANEIAITFGDVIQDFYWNGQDQLELRITRLTTDTATMVWVDRAVYRSTFSKDTGEGKAPIGAKVTVKSAVAVTITVSATLTVADGYNVDSVKSAVREAIFTYIKGLAFESANDVVYTQIGSAILRTDGVVDYANLLVNGGTENIIIGPQEVAVLGTVNLT